MIFATLLLAFAQVARAEEPPSASEIVKALEQAELKRKLALKPYSSFRTYAVENTRFGVRASMKVRVTVDGNGEKRFEILEMDGPGSVRKLVFQRMLDTETKSSKRDGQAATRIASDNYTFRFVETASLDGKKCYVLEADPKSAHPLLFRGRIWVDSEEWAIARIEGAPAQNPSFWVRKTHFVHQYRKTGAQWLAATNESASEIRVFGKSVVKIDYQDYRFDGAPTAGQTGER